MDKLFGGRGGGGVKGEGLDKCVDGAVHCACMYRTKCSQSRVSRSVGRL